MVREYEMATEKIQRIGKLNDWIARQRSEKPEDKCALSRMEPVVWSGQAVRYATAVDGQRDDGLRDGQGGGDGGKGRRGDQAGGRLQLRLRLRPLRESTRKSTSPTPSITPPIPRPNLSPPALRNLYKSRTADHPANLLFFPPKTSPARPASRTSLVFSSLFLLFSHLAGRRGKYYCICIRHPFPGASQLSDVCPCIKLLCITPTCRSLVWAISH